MYYLILSYLRHMLVWELECISSFLVSKDEKMLKNVTFLCLKPGKTIFRVMVEIKITATQNKRKNNSSFWNIQTTWSGRNNHATVNPAKSKIFLQSVIWCEH